MIHSLAGIWLALHSFFIGVPQPNIQEPAVGALSILTGQQGGTGIATTTAGNIGNCLSVAGVSPLSYAFSGCSGGGGSSFSTTSADYWKSVNNFYSTTSANYWSSLGLGFSTTSADYYRSTKWEATYPFPLSATSSLVTFTGGILSTASSTFSGNATTTGNQAFGSIRIPSLGTAAGSILAVNANGLVIATTSSAGGVTSVSGTYPIISTGGATPAISTALGTTTNNVWSGTNAFQDLSIFGWKMGTTTAIVCKQTTACDYQTIQSAIDAGWKDIFVKDGTYAEQITGTSKLKLRAQSLATIITCNGTTQSPCITPADEMTLDGFTVSELNAQLRGVAIDLSNLTKVHINNTRINNFATTTQFIDTLNLTFYNVLLNDDFFNPKTCYEFGGTQANANNIFTTRCRLMAVDGGYGLFASDVRGLKISGGSIEGTTTARTNTAIYFDATSRDNSIDGTWVEATGQGYMAVAGSNNNTVSNTSITSHGVDITDNGTNNRFLSVNRTGTKLFNVGAATSTGFAITSLATAAGAFLAVDPSGNIIPTTTPASSGTDIQFSTTSANFWSSLGLGFSTTSENFYVSAGLSFSTTSADAWRATKWETNYPFPLSATSSSLMLLASTTIGAGGTNGLTTSGNSTTTGNLYFPTTGSFISFFGGDILLTHSTDTLTLTGGTFSPNDIAPSSGSALRTRTSAGNTVLLQARNTGTSVYTDFGQLTAGATPTYSSTSTSATTTGSQHFALGFLSVGSTTINGNATTTGTLFAENASSTKTFGANLSQCNGANQALNWNAGVFSCASISASGSVGNWFTPTTNFGVTANATSTPIWFQAGIFASTSSQLGTTTIANGALLIGTATTSKQVGGGSEAIGVQKAAANGTLLFSGVTNDVNARWLVQVDGLMGWGAGGTSDQDVNFYRAGAGALTVQSASTDSTETFRVNKSSAGTGTKVFGVNTVSSYAETLQLLVNGASGGAKLDVFGNGSTAMRAQNSAASDVAFSAFVTGDAQLRFSFLGDGTQKWGPGTAASDVQLLRTATGALGIQGVNGNNSTSAFNVLTSSGDNIFNVDASNQRVSIGSTSPYAKLSIHATSTGGNQITLFAIGSSTANSTTTLFSVNNTGSTAIGTTSLASMFSIQNKSTSGDFLNLYSSAGSSTLTVDSSTNFTWGADRAGTLHEFVTGNQTETNVAASSLRLRGGSGNGSGTGGGFTLTAGQGGSSGVGGTLSFTSGAGGSSNNGGPINITSGAGGGDGSARSGGLITIAGGLGANGGSSGSILINGGNTTSSGIGNIAGSVTIRGGDLNDPGANGATTGTVTVRGGDGITYFNNGGNVTVRGGDGGSGSNTNGGTLTLQQGNLAGSGIFGGILFNNGAGTLLGQFASSTGYFGVASSSPYAQLSIHTPNGATGSTKTLFAIGSSTSNSTTTLFAIDNIGAMTYGGVTLSPAVTGTGNMVLSASPTLSGTVSVPNIRGGTGAGSALQFKSTSNSSPNSNSFTDFAGGQAGSPIFMRVTGDTGRVGIASTSPYARLVIHANPTDTSFTRDLFVVASSTASATTSHLTVRNDGTMFAPNTSTSAAAQTGAWCYNANGEFIRESAVCTVSALKFKRDVNDLGVGLEELMQLRPVSYFKKDPLDEHDSHQQMGLIADEVAKIPALNEMLVTYDSNGDVHGFRYDQFTALLTKAIQDQQHEIENLKLGKVMVDMKRTAEENWQWGAILLLIGWNVYLTFRRRK